MNNKKDTIIKKTNATKQKETDATKPNKKNGHNFLRGQKNKFFLVNCIISLIYATMVSIIILFTMISPAIEESELYNDKIDIYETTDYDYRIYSPITTQIDEMESESSIDKVFPYYKYNSTIEFNGTSYQTNALFTYDDEALSISEFNENRLLQGTLDNDSEYVILDKLVSDGINALVGDTIHISLSSTSAMQVIVAGIVKTDSFYDTGTIYLSYKGAVKTEIDSAYSSLYLSGALIKSNDLTLCKDYLNDFVPMGEMLSRDYFSSDSEYNTYVSNFMSADYSSRIFDKNAVLSDIISNYEHVLTSSNKLLISGSLVYGLLFMVMVFQSVYAYTYVKRYTKINKIAISTKEMVLRFSIKDFIAALIGGAILLISFNVLSISTYTGFEGLGYLSISLLVAISFVLLIITDGIILKSINRKKI